MRIGWAKKPAFPNLAVLEALGQNARRTRRIVPFRRSVNGFVNMDFSVVAINIDRGNVLGRARCSGPVARVLGTCSGAVTP